VLTDPGLFTNHAGCTRQQDNTCSSSLLWALNRLAVTCLPEDAERTARSSVQTWEIIADLSVKTDQSPEVDSSPAILTDRFWLWASEVERTPGFISVLYLTTVETVTRYGFIPCSKNVPKLPCRADLSVFRTLTCSFM
jgi:hypothetical protein